MIGLDCNILVQLAFADHPANAKTLTAVHAEMRQNRKLVFPPLIATEFLHVVTDERRFSQIFTDNETDPGVTRKVRETISITTSDLWKSVQIYGRTALSRLNLSRQ